jgi:hypothetical protein
LVFPEKESRLKRCEDMFDFQLLGLAD